MNMKKTKKEARTKIKQEQDGVESQDKIERQSETGRHKKKVNYLKIVIKNSLQEILYNSHDKL